MKMIKVLMLVPNLQVDSGVTSFVMNYYRKIDPKQIHIDFVVYFDIKTSCYMEIKANGGKIFILPSVKNIVKHIKACKKILAQGDYDIVHNNTLHVALPMMLCAKLHHVPVRILHSHSSKMGETKKKELRNKMFLPLLRSLATDYAACSKLAGNAMFGSSHYEIIPNVIQTDKYIFNEEIRNNVRHKMGVENKFVVSTVGRLAEQKNPFFAIDVFKELVNIMPNTEYWWIGSGELDNQVAAYVQQQGLADKVKLLGSRNDVIDLYQAMDVFFLPSLFEGLPLTGVEAQAMGLPMVVSDTVTNEMVYTDLVNYMGLKKSVEEWANLIKQLYNVKKDRTLYNDQLQKSSFCDSKCGERLKNMYVKLLSDNYKYTTRSLK